MKKIFRKYLIVFSLILLPCHSLRSCVWGVEYEDIMFMIMNPNILNNKAWLNYYYTTHFYYGDLQLSDTDERKLAREWKAQLNLKASEEDIYQYLFNEKNSSFESYDAIKKDMDNIQEWRNFIQFAKACESNVYTDDTWTGIYTDSLILTRHDLIKE